MTDNYNMRTCREIHDWGHPYCRAKLYNGIVWSELVKEMREENASRQSR